MFPQIGFAQLLGLSDCDWFFENVWECEPRLVSGAIEGSKDRIMTLDDFEALLTSSIPGENVGSSVVEAGVARMLDGRGSERLLLVEEAYRKRCTILQSGLQLRWVPLARICQDIENQFFIRGVPLAEGVTANSYLTPAHSQGFDLHYDNHCAIVLQLHGSKKWTIFAPVDELPVERCTRPILLQELDAPLMETRLCAGDVLYIPRGYPHSAATAEEISLHVTLSVRPVTWAEAICAFCESEPLFRKSVTRTSNGWARGNGQTFFVNALLRKLSDMCVNSVVQTLAATKLVQLPYLPTRGLRIADAGRQLHGSIPLVRIWHAIASETEQGQAALKFPGSVLQLPIQMKPVFQFIAAHAEFTPAMLPEIQGEYDPLELVRVLIKKGLLQPNVQTPNQNYTSSDNLAGVA